MFSERLMEIGINPRDVWVFNDHPETTFEDVYAVCLEVDCRLATQVTKKKEENDVNRVFQPQK
jgi:hypothetical protein